MLGYRCESRRGASGPGPLSGCCLARGWRTGGARARSRDAIRPAAPGIEQSSQVSSTDAPRQSTNHQAILAAKKRQGGQLNDAGKQRTQVDQRRKTGIGSDYSARNIGPDRLGPTAADSGHPSVAKYRGSISALEVASTGTRHTYTKTGHISRARPLGAIAACPRQPRRAGSHPRGQSCPSSRTCGC